MPKALEDEDSEEPEDVEEDDDEESAAPEAEEDDQAEASLEELLAKRRVDAGDDDTSVLDLTPEERVESLQVRATPKQANEFVCSNCHLVKYNSQLADRRRKLCRDCV